MIKADVKAGYRDAKDDEDLDKDIDYKFIDSRIRTDHKIGEDYRVYNEASNYKKEYKADGQYDNEGFELVQGWKLKPVSAKTATLTFDVNLDYKKFNYTTQNKLDFEKFGALLKATIDQKKDWKVYAGFGYAKRNQTDKTKDRNDYICLAGYETDIISNKLELGLNGECTTRDYKNAGDKELYRIKVEINYKI